MWTKPAKFQNSFFDFDVAALGFNHTGFEIGSI